MSIGSNRIWERTLLCGCGECRLKRPESGKCPLESANGAEWYWSSRERTKEDGAVLSGENNLESGYTDETVEDELVAV